MDRRSRRNKRTLPEPQQSSPVVVGSEVQTATVGVESPAGSSGVKRGRIQPQQQGQPVAGGTAVQERDDAAGASTQPTPASNSSNRVLPGLIDYFPDISSTNRLTRSAVRNKAKRSEQPAPINYGQQASGRRRNLSNRVLPASSSGDGVAAVAACEMDNRSQTTANQKVVGKKAKSQAKAYTRTVQSSTTNSGSESTAVGGETSTSSAAAAVAAGLPSRLAQGHSFLNALGPRVQNLLMRCPMTSNIDRVNSLLSSMQKHDDTSTQLQALIELCNLLAMSSDEVLGTCFPYKELMRVLTRMLQSEQNNYDITTHVCRALTNLIELAPRVCASLVDTVPHLLAKLKRVECIDVAEAALSTLELLSRRHAKNILLADGIECCLAFLDFFPIVSQRSALQIVANCCYHLTPKEFNFLTQALHVLTQRLMSQDKKTVELMCTTFGRLVDNFLASPEHVAKLCDAGLLKNVRQMLVSSPSMLSSAMLVNVLRMLHQICRCCNQIAVQLVSTGIVSTIHFLLTGCLEADTEKRELLARSPLELLELVVFIGELWPALPHDGLFEVDAWLLLLQQPGGAQDAAIDAATLARNVTWSWRQDRESWRQFMAVENRLLEAAFASQEEDVTLTIQGCICTVDFAAMTITFEDDGQVYPVIRRVNNHNGGGKISGGQQELPATDVRLTLLNQQPQYYEEIVRTIFPLLYEVYTSVGGPAVRQECLMTFLKVVCHGTERMLDVLASSIPLPSLIAGMLSSQDLKPIVCALQLTRLLLDKKTDAFVACFEREGVVHQLSRLPEHLKSVSSMSASIGSSDDVEHTATAGYPPHVGGPYSMAFGLNATTGSNPFESLVMQGNRWMSLANVAAAAAAAGSPLLSTAAGGSRAAVPVSLLASRQAAAGQQHAGVANDLAPNGGTYRLTDAGVMDRTMAAMSTSFEVTPSASAMRSVGGVRTRGRRKTEDVGEASRDLPPPAQAQQQQSGTSNRGHHRPSLFSMPFVRYPGGRQVQMRRMPTGRGAVSSNNNNGCPASSMANLGCDYSRLAAVASSSTAEQRQSAKTMNDKVLGWAEATARHIMDTYRSKRDSGALGVGLPVVDRLSRAAVKLAGDQYAEGLAEIAAVLLSDVTCFEILRSGLVDALIAFLTSGPWEQLRQRLVDFCDALFGLRVDRRQQDGVAEVVAPHGPDAGTAGRNLICKLVLCVNQLEQFPIKIHDITYGQQSNLRGLQALRFLHEQLIRCAPMRHPTETALRQWRKGALRVDPLAQVSAIERYLLSKGVRRVSAKTERSDDDDEGSESLGEEEEEEAQDEEGVGSSSSNVDAISRVHRQAASNQTTAAPVAAPNGGAGGQHELQLLMNDQVLPYDITIYQAVRQYGGRSSHTVVHPDGAMVSDRYGSSDLWTNVFPIWYRSVPQDSQAAGESSSAAAAACRSRRSGGAGRRGSAAAAAVKKKPAAAAAANYGDWLDRMLKAPCTVTGEDPSLKCLSLLRALFLVCRHWKVLYEDRALVAETAATLGPLVASSAFQVPKIMAKVSRQLLDLMVIVVNQLPEWLEQLAFYCPFVMPFETRVYILNIIALGRDRALQRLLDAVGDSGMAGGSSAERLAPRIERRKVCIARSDILKQAERVLNNVGQSMAVLEVEYENEVGSGLGPTLEFFAMVSFSLQDAQLNMWHGDAVVPRYKPTDNIQVIVQNEAGLYPSTAQASAAAGGSKQMASFKLVGKLLARTLLDRRTVDLPLNPLFFNWLLNLDHCFTSSDLYLLDVAIGRSVECLRELMLLAEQSDEAREKAAQTLANMELDFTLPGNAAVPLKPDGANIPVTIDVLPEYIKLVTQYYLREGVREQMTVVRESFHSIIDLRYLKMFLPEEMDQLFSGCRINSDVWDSHLLHHAIHPDHGYTHESPQIRWLVDLMSSFEPEERRNFLQFLTGSPRLPVGGLRNLHPPLTVVRKHCDTGNVDDQLPSVMTCVNYLKLPEYTSRETMKQRLMTAIAYGRFAFHLS